jgi:hypothetical protein
MRRLQFRPDVNLGQIVTAIVYLISGIFFFAKLDSRVSQLEKSTARQEVSLEKLNDNQTSISRALERFATLQEQQRLRPKP